VTWSTILTFCGAWQKRGRGSEVGAVFDSRICRPNGRANSRLQRSAATPAAQPDRSADSVRLAARVAGYPSPGLSFRYEDRDLHPGQRLR
jgi:hypothetical protein